MTWFKVSAGMWGVFEVGEAGNRAMGLWVRAGSWLAYYGRPDRDLIPARLLRALDSTRKDAQALVDAGLWEEVEGGYRFTNAIFANSGSGIMWEVDYAGPVRIPVRDDIRRAVYERDEYTCRECGTTANLSVDHIVPVIRGGGNDLSNLQTLCRSCNSRKGAR